MLRLRSLWGIVLVAMTGGTALGQSLMPVADPFAPMTVSQGTAPAGSPLSALPGLQPVSHTQSQFAQPQPAPAFGIPLPETVLGLPVVSNHKLFGLFRESDHEFSRFISPMSNPVFFEDPRTLTEARAIFLNHQIPGELGGNNVQVVAMQLRGAITERLSIIATKNGYLFSQNPLLRDGFADLNAGLKYNLYRDVDTQTLLSTGFTYGIPLGSTRALQGRGTGEFNFFASGGTEFLENWHYISTAGIRVPTHTTQQNLSTYWSNHVDVRLGETGFYLFTEVNWFHWLTSANGFPVPVEGLDFFNLGSVGVAGNDIVTGAYGLKYKPSKYLEFGVAYEIPYTRRRDILQDRIAVEAIFRY
jgi:hypothetical protein